MLNLMRFMVVHYRGGLARVLVFTSLFAALAAGAQFLSVWYLGVIMDAIPQGAAVVLEYFVIIAVSVIAYAMSNAA